MKIALGLLLVIAPVGSALADSTLDVIAKTQARIAGINAQIFAEQTTSERSRAALVSRGNEFNSLKARHDALQRQYANDSTAYNANCAGRPLSYGNCPSWRAKVLAEQQQLAPALANMEQRANEIKRQGQQLSNELVVSNARIQKLMNDKSELQASVESLKASAAQAPSAESPAQTEKQATDKNTGTCAFGTTCNPSHPDLGGSPENKQVVTHDATDQLKSAEKSGEEANRKGISDEDAKAKSNCQFDTKGCGDYVSNPPINKVPGQSPGAAELASHIPGPAKNDPEIQNNMRYYEKLESLKIDTQTKLAAIEQKIKNKEVDPKILEVEKSQLNFDLNQSNQGQKTIKDQIQKRLIAVNTPWIEDPAPTPKANQ